MAAKAVSNRKYVAGDKPVLQKAGRIDHQTSLLTVSCLDEKPPRKKPGESNGCPMTPPAVGAKAVLKPTKAMTTSAEPVIKIVFSRLKWSSSPSSPTSRKPTEIVI